MSFFKRLVRAYRDTVTATAYDFLADTEEGWTEEDSKRLADFFNSLTGRKLKARLTNYVIKCAVESTRQPANLLYHAGIARGASLTVNAIEQHFIACPPRSEDTSETEPASSVADGLALK